MRSLCLAIAVLAVMFAAAWCQGAVTDDRLYRLGEDDPGASALAPGNDPTRDHYSAANNAAKVGLTFYHGTSGVGPPVPIGLVPGSTYSMEFTNVDSRYVAPSALAGVTENFGMEAYLQVSNGVTFARAFYTGGAGFPLDPVSRGYGLGIDGGFYTAFVNGNPIPTTVSVIPNSPVEMALVNTGGPNFTVYVQALPVMNFSIAAVSPPLPNDVLSIGNFNGNQSPPFFAGVVDEARVFEFAPGSFQPGTDLGPAAVPEPSVLVLLLSLAGTGWMCYRRRRSV